MNDTVFVETDESPIHPPLDQNRKCITSGWVSRETYLASVRQLTAVNRCITWHLKTVACMLAVSGAVNVVLLILWVAK